MILDILQPKANSLLCPKCERPLEDHDEDRCKRKMSRRFFLGAATGVVLAAAMPANKALYSLTKSVPSPTAWFSGARHILSVKGDCFVTSIRNLGVSEREVEGLRRAGFDVYVSHDDAAAKIEYYKQRQRVIYAEIEKGDTFDDQEQARLRRCIAAYDKDIKVLEMPHFTDEARRENLATKQYNIIMDRYEDKSAPISEYENKVTKLFTTPIEVSV